MRFALLIAFVAAAGAVVWLTFVGEAASFEIAGAYVAASVVALALAWFQRSWAGMVKWAWIALSLVMIFAIVTGPLDYLQVS